MAASIHEVYQKVSTSNPAIERSLMMEASLRAKHYSALNTLQKNDGHSRQAKEPERQEKGKEQDRNSSTYGGPVCFLSPLVYHLQHH